MKPEQLFAVAPLPIKRKADIAKIFGVSEDTVQGWAREGAPIFMAGKRYQADYHALVGWLCRNKPAVQASRDEWE